jgi:hypothetical protein
VRAPGPGRKTQLGAALYARGPVWVTGSQAADDVRDAHRLPEGAAEAIATALVLPIREGVARIGLLELLATESADRDEDVVRGVEAAGLQVGQFVAFTRARSRRP